MDLGQTAGEVSPLMSRDVDRAARALADGGLVAMPTETVYGLAADAENSAAVGRVFRVKGRPEDHPLIVHVASTSALAERTGWAREVPRFAHALAEAFWPGPLTLIVPRGHRAADYVTGGLESVGLRCPDRPVALALLRALSNETGRTQAGVAAPSANRFGRVSPTSARDVEAELGNLLNADRDLILDDGSCSVGLESTIVDCTGDHPAVLRPGAISSREVASATGLTVVSASGQVRAPGMLSSHYAPAAKVILAEDEDDLAVIASAARGRVGVIAERRVPTPPGSIRVGEPENVSAYARELYATLRAGDAQHCDLLVALAPPPGSSPAGLTAAITDRLRRAAAARG